MLHDAVLVAPHISIGAANFRYPFDSEDLAGYILMKMGQSGCPSPATIPQ